MAIHQVVFRLNDEVQDDRDVLELLDSYPYGSIHQSAKAIVSTFAKQGLEHPGSNPSVARDYYPHQVAPPSNQLGYSAPIDQPQYVEPIQPVEQDFYEEPIETPPVVEGGLGPISFDFGAC